MRCTGCETELPEDALFCDQCGMPVHGANPDADSLQQAYWDYPQPSEAIALQAGDTIPLPADAIVPLQAGNGPTPPTDAAPDAPRPDAVEPESQTAEGPPSGLPDAEDWRGADSHPANEDDPEGTQADDGGFPTIFIPQGMPMVLPPSPPEGPSLSRMAIAAIAAIATAFAILIIAAVIVFLRSVLQ